MSVKNEIINLHELPVDSLIDIGGHEFRFTGFEKRNVGFGKVEHFVFQCEKPKHEKIIPRFSNSKIKIKKIDEKYKM